MPGSSGWDTGEIIPDDQLPEEWDDFPIPEDIEPAEDEKSYVTWEKSLVGVANAIRSVARISNKLVWPYGYITALAYLKENGTEGQGQSVQAVWGVDSDTGEYVSYRVDSNGYIVKQVLHHITVTTPPTKLEYNDGDTIDYTGIVVGAYEEDNTAFILPSGTNTVPFSELTFSVTTAVYPTSGSTT